MTTIPKEKRIEKLNSLLIQKGTALDVGVGNTFMKIYPSRQFTKVTGINIEESVVRELQKGRKNHPEWHFIIGDINEYKPVEDFDLITMLHVAEHLTLPDLSIVLDRLTAVCKKQFMIETPEQFDSNERSVVEKESPYQLHQSLVTANFLLQWNFHLAFRYWQNPQFSNAIYLKTIE